MADYFVSLDGLALGDAVVRCEDGPDGPGWLLFTHASAILEAHSIGDVAGVVEAACRHADSGWVVGFVAYEGGPAFDRAILVRHGCSQPLAWFALYDQVPAHYRELLPSGRPVAITLNEPEFSFEEYSARFNRLEQSLEAGNCYQANLTFRQRFKLVGTAADFFVDRCGVRPPPFATFLHGGEWRLASFSPELLLERIGEEVTMRPMKGTASSPVAPGARCRAAEQLRTDPKTIAENVMIVDMVRNDLGAVAEVGSVSTPRLLDVEQHRGLLQVTSTVTARSSVPTEKLLASVFPPASVTGAPKVAATKVIAELEGSPRGAYCGALGLLSPGRQRFSVAIRTARIAGEAGEFGIGSGVVWDSKAAAEYEECLAKRDFLMNPGTQWALIEAFSSDSLGDEARVDQHLMRLAGSAATLGVPVDLKSIRRQIAELEKPLSSMKVRIAVGKAGDSIVTLEPSAFGTVPIRATLASSPVNSHDSNFRHKTNSRAVLDSHLGAHLDFDEVLLYNEVDELTEFCRGNVVVQLNSVLYTPNPDSGCLAGIHVSNLVKGGRVRRRRLKLADLDRAEEIYLSNSVVGLLQVHLL